MRETLIPYLNKKTKFKQRTHTHPYPSLPIYPICLYAFVHQKIRFCYPFLTFPRLTVLKRFNKFQPIIDLSVFFLLKYTIINLKYTIIKPSSIGKNDFQSIQKSYQSLTVSCFWNFNVMIRNGKSSVLFRINLEPHYS